jgi:hypothetical protein
MSAPKRSASKPPAGGALLRRGAHCPLTIDLRLGFGRVLMARGAHCLSTIDLRARTPREPLGAWLLRPSNYRFAGPLLPSNCRLIGRNHP